MLAIRLQRTGRKKLAHYRVIVQEAQKSPKSEKVVDRIGHYNPHTKELVIDKEKAELYLKNGAQPSDKVARLLKSEKVKLPTWVVLDAPKKSKTKNIEKLRKNRPAEEKTSVSTEKTEDVAEETKQEQSDDTPESAEENSPAEEEKTIEKEQKVADAPEAKEQSSEKDSEAKA